MIIEIRDDQHWHELRAKHIGASEISALFGHSPYLTAYTLFEMKRGKAPAPPIHDEQSSLGLGMEPAIAGLYARAQNLDVVKVREYHECDAMPLLGCSLDYKFIHPEHGFVPVEIKHVSTHAWRAHGWNNEEDYLPPHIEFQLIDQMLITKAKEGRVVAFCDGKIYHFIRRADEPRVQSMAKEIALAMLDFGRRLRENDPPDAFGDASLDLRTLGYSMPSDKEAPALDLTREPDANQIIETLIDWQAQEYMAKNEIDRCKVKLTELMRKNCNTDAIPAEAFTENFTLRRTVSDIAATTVQRKASKMVRFTVKKREDAEAPVQAEETSVLMAG